MVHAMNEGFCGRRAVLRATLGLGLIQVGALPLMEGQDNPAAARPREGDFLVKSGDDSATPLTPDDVKPGQKQTLVFAMDAATKTVRSGSRLNRILLVKLDIDKLTPETRVRSADGIVAYSALCSHAGCDVSDWLPEEQALFCSCHASKFEPKDGAKVLDGPAANPLPALPLRITDGKLVVAKPFTARVTFEG